MTCHLHIPLLFTLVLLCSCQLYDASEILVDLSKHNEQFFTFLSVSLLTSQVARARRLKAACSDPISMLLDGTSKYTIKVRSLRVIGSFHLMVSCNKPITTSPTLASAIYDSSNGELIWNGGPLFQYFTTFNFQVSRFEGRNVLSIFHLKSSDGAIIDGTQLPSVLH